MNKKQVFHQKYDKILTIKEGYNSMKNKEKIVIIGGGYAGVLTGKKLAKKFKKDDDVEITLIDKNPYHTMLTELHEVSAGRVPEDSIRIDLKTIFAKRKVNVVLDEVSKIEFDENYVQGKDEKYEYDYLVVATGSKPTFWGVKGAEEYSKQLWSYEDAVNLKEHILTMFRKAEQERDPAERERLLTFVVVGGGFTGIEMAGELGEWKNRLCKEFDVEEEEVKLYVMDVLPKILPMFPDKLIEKTKKRLKKLGVEVMNNAAITEVTEECVMAKDVCTIPTNTVIWAAGVEGADVIGESDVKQEGRKRIVTNEELQSVEHDNVYVSGDNIFYVPEGEKRPVPQMVENAEHSSGLVAHNITSSIRGGEKKEYKPAFHGAMVCIGGKYGVAHLGMPGKFFSLSGFFAMFIKHFINLVYFVQVAGFNKCWSYILHEFFHVPDRRSIVGGHFSKSSPNFWLVPVRLFLGYSWLSEGLAKLPKILADPSNIFLIPAPPSDATSAASAAQETTEAVQALPVPDFIKGIMDWTMDSFFYNGHGGYTKLAEFFQGFMVCAEIILGLLLIAGLFTAIASIGSIVMSIMIWTSGMAAYDILWYALVGCALIGGSGSTFGLDYYVLPFLKKYWKRIPIIKKYYLYTD